MLCNSPGASPPPLETATTQIELTLLNKHREPFTKTIDFVDGELVQTGGSQGMPFGRAYRLKLTGLIGIGHLIRRTPSNEAYTLGVFEGGASVAERLAKTWLPLEYTPLGAIADVYVITQKELQQRRDAGLDATLEINRSAEFLKYATGRPVLMLCDTDLKGSRPEWAAHFAAHPEAVWGCLCLVCPGLIGAGHLYRRSTSAGLSHPATGMRFPGSGGVHTYMLVRDGSDIRRALNALHERLWLAGLGWGLISDNGGILPRSLADVSVGTGERVVFEANPILLGGLAQDAAARMPVVVEGAIIDTRSAILDLTAEERVRFDKLWAAEQARLADAAAVVRDRWVQARAQKMVDDTGRALSDCIAALERSSRIKTNRPTADRSHCWIAELLPPFELLFRDPELAGATVGDVLLDPLRFKGCDLADPHGGEDYDPRRDKAIVVWPRNGKPYIFSLAHGGGAYTLVDDSPGWSSQDVRDRQVKARFAGAGPIVDVPGTPPPQGSAPPQQRRDTRASTIARLATQMLANGTADDQIRSRLHAHNRTLTPPLLTARVDELIENARAFLKKETSNVH